MIYSYADCGHLIRIISSECPGYHGTAEFSNLKARSHFLERHGSGGHSRGHLNDNAPIRYCFYSNDIYMDGAYTWGIACWTLCMIFGQKSINLT